MCQISAHRVVGSVRRSLPSVCTSQRLPPPPLRKVVVHYQSVAEPATITRLVCQLHRSSGEVVKQRPRCLPGNTSADVIITFQRPVCVELYKDFRDYGRLMLRVAGHTVAAGLITEVSGRQREDRRANVVDED